MANISPYDFIVVLPQTIIEIPQSSNLSWLTLFYALPKELVEKRAEYLELPRNIHQVLQSEKYTAMIQTDSFLELVWDCYAWSAWQFFQIPHQDGTHHDIPGDWSHYSGDFPLWRLSYDSRVLDEEYAKLEQEYAAAYEQFKVVRSDSQTLWKIKSHVDSARQNIERKQEQNNRKRQEQEL